MAYITRYGFLGVINGRAILFATEDEYYEMKSEEENKQ